MLSEKKRDRFILHSNGGQSTAVALWDKGGEFTVCCGYVPL
jgi:hypothetical protein